ncbi:MAG TPA: hypothetical protein VEK34_13075 [Methylocella sp.]|nr:hypothetical protein [Methylocella sp.]
MRHDLPASRARADDVADKGQIGALLPRLDLLLLDLQAGVRSHR